MQRLLVRQARLAVLGGGLILLLGMPRQSRAATNEAEVNAGIEVGWQKTFRRPVDDEWVAPPMCSPVAGYAHAGGACCLEGAAVDDVGASAGTPEREDAACRAKPAGPNVHSSPMVREWFEIRQDFGPWSVYLSSPGNDRWVAT
jgi:hypothetical protein